MTTYIKTTKIVIDEYLAVKNQFRLQLVLLSYQSLLQNYFNENSVEVSFFITEISNKNSGKSIDKESKLSMKMLCMEDYGKANASYYTLPLGLNNYESSFEAFLYLKSNDVLSTLSSESYINIVKSIYYDYFVEWYKPFLSKPQMDDYILKVDNFYELIRHDLISAKSEGGVEIILNKCESLSLMKTEKSSGALPYIKKNTWITYALVLLLIISLPILLIWAYTAVLNLIDIEISSLSSAVGAMISSIVTAATSIFIARKRS